MSEWYPVSRPIEVRGGIKAQTKKGAFGKNWWGKRWIEVLEQMDLGGRLQRARSYARQGQVRDLEIQKGQVMARVQGSRRTPYKVTIQFKSYTVKQWSKLIESVLEKPIYAAQLLNNEMPSDLERIFVEAGCPLFPSEKGDLITNCSCPDWSNPCKHIAAVYYLMSESFDQDPFLLLKLRGMDRESFLEELRGQIPPDPIEASCATDRLQSMEPRDFWNGQLPQNGWSVLSENGVKIRAALPKRLGSINWWRGEVPLAESMEDLYRKVHERMDS